MRSLDDPQLMREIIMDHYEHTRNRGLVDDQTYQKVNMNSDTCIDDLDIQVKFDGDKIADVRYDGEACAICTSSTSIMSTLAVSYTHLDVYKRQAYCSYVFSSSLTCLSIAF